MSRLTRQGLSPLISHPHQRTPGVPGSYRSVTCRRCRACPTLSPQREQNSRDDAYNGLNRSGLELAASAEAYYLIAIVTLAWLSTPPIFTTTGMAGPVGAVAGTTTLICNT